MHKVLIVDNEPFIRKGLVSLMDWDALHCQVVGAADNGLAALDIMAQQRVDILVTDIRMPGMDGLELTRRVRSLYPEVKVILVTAFSEFAYAQEALRQQVVDFVIKPTSREKMNAAISRAIELLKSDGQKETLKRVLHEKHQDNLGLERKLFVEGLLSGSRLSLLYVHTQAARLQLPLAGSSLLAIRVMSPREVAETALAMFMEEAMGYLATLCPGEELLLLPAEADMFYGLYLKQDQQQLGSLMEEYIALADNMTEFTVQLGVSLPVEDPMQLGLAARQAREALFYLSYEDHPGYLYYHQVPQVTAKTAQALRDVLHTVAEAFRQKDIQGVEMAMGVLTESVTAHRIPLVEVRRLMTLLYHICINTLMDYNLLEQGILPGAEQFLQQTQAEDLSQPFLDIARKIFQLITQESSSQEGPVRFVEQYVRNNLEKDLSLEHLASLVHLSPSYLSREFKRQAGKNLSAFITARRMDKARELLAEGNLKNYEIAHLVGYEDPVYFSRAFKKATGHKPSEYRQQAQQS